MRPTTTHSSFSFHCCFFVSATTIWRVGDVSDIEKRRPPGMSKHASARRCDDGGDGSRAGLERRWRGESLPGSRAAFAGRAGRCGREPEGRGLELIHSLPLVFARNEPWRENSRPSDQSRAALHPRASTPLVRFQFRAILPRLKHPLARHHASRAQRRALSPSRFPGERPPPSPPRLPHAHAHSRLVCRCAARHVDWRSVTRHFPKVSSSFPTT